MMASELVPTTRNRKTRNDDVIVISLSERVFRLENTLENVLPTLATKADLNRVEGNLRADFKEVEGKLRAEIKEVEGKLRAEIKDVHRTLDVKIESVRSEVKDVHRQLDVKIESVRSEVKDVHQTLDVKISETANKQIKWTIFLFVGLFGALATIIYSGQSSTNAALDRIDRRFEQMDRRFERLEQALFVVRPEIQAALPKPEPVPDPD